MKKRIRIRRRDGIKQRYWVGRKIRKNYGAWKTEPGQYIQRIPPKEFIKRAGLHDLPEEKYPLLLGKYYDAKEQKLQPIEKLSEHIKSKKTKVWIPWIDDPTPVGALHEGKHRAFAAELAGEELIPVAVPLPKEKREELAEEFIKEAFPDSHFSYQNEWRERFRKGHPEQRMDPTTAKIFDKILKKHGLK